jgi:hypothetical protein
MHNAHRRDIGILDFRSLVPMKTAEPLGDVDKPVDPELLGPSVCIISSI